MIPFFDEEYEIDNIEEGNHNFIFLPTLTDQQKVENKNLIEEINERAKKSMEESRTAKSRWHHRQILQVRLRELKNTV